MDNILFIPGIANPVSEIRQLLFGAGQPGGSWIPTLSSAMIAANSFGSGVTDILDLSGNNNPFSQATPASRGAWFREPKTGRRNLLDATATLSTQSVTVAAVQKTLSFRGTGTVTLSGASTAGPLVGTGANDIVSLTFTPTAGSLTLTVSGTVNDAQLNAGATRGAYQNVVSAFDITEAGQRDCYGVRFDGIDDGYRSGNINMSAASAITMFAAVRKRANVGFILEHAPNGIPGASGAVALNQETQYRSLSRRPTLVSATVSTGFAPPNVSIVTGKIRSNVLNELWVNNVLVATNTNDQGTDPFLNAPLNLGQRSSLSSFLDGDVFGVIFVAGDVPQATFQRVNRLLSRITPTVNL
jgi:hypothetical protein